VRRFTLGQGEQLAGWMESLEGDRVADVLVLLDFVPAALGGVPADATPLARWVEDGNTLVWTGSTPLLEEVRDDGTLSTSVLAADQFFGATAPFIVGGGGPETPTALGQRIVPSLPSYRTQRAVRYDRLGPAWHVARLFATDGDFDSDAIELVHTNGGTYAQFLCDDADLPRAEVLSQYLLDKLGGLRLGVAGKPPH